MKIRQVVASEKERMKGGLQHGVMETIHGGAGHCDTDNMDNVLTDN